MQPTFRSPYFAILESYAATLLAGPEARQQAHKPPLAAGQIGVFGSLGQSDWYVDTDYAAIRTGVRRALADPTAKTVDLIIDSPGGSVLGLPETADVIHAANRVKPVRAFVTGIAASAAYWLASQASTITLTPSGEVGSVGVLDMHADITGALEKAGVKLTAITAGEHKVERAPFTPLSDDAKAHMQSNVTAWYSDFLSSIRRGRGARASAGNYGGGRMLSSREALKAGMVDFIGGDFMTLLELSYQRRKAKAEATALLDAAMGASRALSIAEQVRFDALTIRIHELDAAMGERESLRKLAN